MDLNSISNLHNNDNHFLGSSKYFLNQEDFLSKFSVFNRNRSRRHSSDDDGDSDRDSSPPSYSMSGNDNLGPTRRSTRVPKPKQDADFVTFPLLDRDEHGNPIPLTPSSMPLHKAEDDEDDIPYRLMDYPRPPQQSQSSTVTSSVVSSSPGRKPRTVAEMRAATVTNKKQARWPDDELYHVKSFVPLIMPQQITNPSTMKNKMTMCKPLVSEREVEAKPTRCTIATQTGFFLFFDFKLKNLFLGYRNGKYDSRCFFSFLTRTYLSPITNTKLSVISTESSPNSGSGFCTDYDTSDKKNL